MVDTIKMTNPTHFPMLPVGSFRSFLPSFTHFQHRTGRAYLRSILSPLCTTFLPTPFPNAGNKVFVRQHLPVQKVCSQGYYKLRPIVLALVYTVPLLSCSALRAPSSTYFLLVGASFLSRNYSATPNPYKVC